MLTNKQNLFVQEYLIDMNAAAAARRAGYSSKSADKIGYQLLENPRVYERIKIEMNKRMEKLEITKDRILQELAKIAFFNVTELLEFNEKNELRVKPLSQIPINSLAAVKSISGGDSGLNIHLNDKMSAIKLLGDYYKLWSGEGHKDESSQIGRTQVIQRVLDLVRKRADKEEAKTQSELAI